MRQTETWDKGRIGSILPDPSVRNPDKGNPGISPDCAPKIETADLLLGGMIKATTPASRNIGFGWFVEAGDPEPGVGYSGLRRIISLHS